MRATDNSRGIEMNCMKERSSELQRLVEAVKEKHDYMKEWYNSRNTKIVDGVKRITEGFEFVRRRVNIPWADRCKQQEVLQKRYHDAEDPGNPDPSATLEQPPATTSTQLIVFKPSQLGSSQGTSSGTAVHPITGEILEEGEIVAHLSHEQLLALNEMKEVDDAEIDKMPIEPDTETVENIEEIVFEGETRKSTYVRADGMGFDSFDEEWMNENREEIDEQLKNRTSSDNPTDSFQEWRKRFLLKVEKPTPPEAQVDFLQFEKVKPHGKILSWMFVKDIHCVAIKREHRIQYFNSLLSILSLPFYDVAALSKLDIINRSNYFGTMLFARKIKFERKKGWKDESFKPQFPVYQQIKFTLDPSTNTARYKLIYQPAKVMDKIPLMPMKQKFL
ncbi:hypothetical protein HanHA300_Chr10g0348351 [Helianthus annuus]|nr:hypothetical protein HanHA300_Chr10g0348351 [Helianthus annuus]KAJ0520219.1 hypothetical protein HanIR_Chr10g0456961 [Helianthus annuus]KAJ0695674.1 hypothetical protein HanLR1_Chr10g0348181 [Helianthus annuus]